MSARTDPKVTRQNLLNLLAGIIKLKTDIPDEDILNIFAVTAKAFPVSFDNAATRSYDADAERMINEIVRIRKSPGFTTQVTSCIQREAETAYKSNKPMLAGRLLKLNESIGEVAKSNYASNGFIPVVTPHKQLMQSLNEFIATGEVTGESKETKTKFIKPEAPKKPVSRVLTKPEKPKHTKTDDEFLDNVQYALKTLKPYYESKKERDEACGLIDKITEAVKRSGSRNLIQSCSGLLVAMSDELQIRRGPEFALILLQEAQKLNKYPALPDIPGVKRPTGYFTSSYKEESLKQARKHDTAVLFNVVQSEATQAQSEMPLKDSAQQIVQQQTLHYKAG